MNVATAQVINQRKSNFQSENSNPLVLSDRRLSKGKPSPFTTIDPPSQKDSLKNKKIRQLRRHLKINDTIAAILGISGVVLAIIDYEYFYYVNIKRVCNAIKIDGVDQFQCERTFNGITTTETTISNLLPLEPETYFQAQEGNEIFRALISISTFAVNALQIVHSILAFKLAIEKGNIPSDSNYFKSRNFKQFFFEAIIIGIHCPAGVESVFKITQLGYTMYYSFNGCAMSFMLIRFYLVFRLFAHYSKWTSEMAENCCEPEGCEANTFFAVKAVLKEKPYTALLFLMVISTMIFGIAVRHFERPFYQRMQTNSSGYQDYSYIWNGMWLIMITMMTVGYGDFYPRTHMGRFICILACFWGVFLVSMVTVTLTITTSFDTKEEKAFEILYRLNIKEEMKKKGAVILTQILKMIAIKKKHDAKMIDDATFKATKINFRNILEIKLQFFRDILSQLPDFEISPEELLRQLSEKIDRDLDEIRDIIFSMMQIEDQLSDLETSQKSLEKSINQSMLYTRAINQKLLQFRANLMERINNNSLESNQGINGSQKEQLESLLGLNHGNNHT